MTQYMLFLSVFTFSANISQTHIPAYKQLWSAVFPRSDIVPLVFTDTLLS